MKTKGQISIFIILGLLIAAVIIGITFFRTEVYTKLGEVGIVKEAVLPAQVENIRSGTQACLQFFGENAIIITGLQGGYVNFDSRVQYSTVFADLLEAPEFYQGTTYLYYKGQKRVPSLETIEREIANYIKENMEECQKAYTGFKVDYDTRPQIGVEIQDDRVGFDIVWPIIISKEESEYTIREFKFDMPIRVGEMYKIVNEIVDTQVELKSKDVCVSCLTDISAENDVRIDFQGIGEDTIYLITDEESKIGENFYVFVIANKF